MPAQGLRETNTSDVCLDASSCSGPLVVNHVSARFIAQRHLVPEVPVALMVNVGRCRPKVMQSATSFTEHDRAACVHDTSPAVTAASKAGKPSEHARGTIRAALGRQQARDPRYGFLSPINAY